ncbi:tRNA (guanosine(46)-N7)-methyltransferase TrmB [Thermodesulfovibrio sp. 3907-1M]|uniref:tRNA (guanine-N(7)-)-methyltransferase n=1 Tax=Thermodesulfovibrio autotrophicus TaxID=3118333 RepID=A0AAU8H1J8_9BACT
MQNYIDYRKTQKPLEFENLVVEIGFGSGDFLIKLAKENRNEIFFGIEKSWIPVNKLLKKCGLKKINNIYCIRLDAYWAFQLLFRDNSVKKIIMNYPDPWFKKSHAERRLTRRENLYVYAKKLINDGEVKIRTDDYSFVEFTLQEASFLNCFSINVSNPTINEPLTKYEKRWLSMGKNIWDIVLKKEKEPITLKINEIKEVSELYPVRISADRVDVELVAYKEFKIEEALYIKCFSIWKKGQDYAVEVLLSENGFLQSFMVTVKKKNDYFIIDVSKFSEVLKTEGIQKALNFLAKIIGKERS